MPLKTQSTYCLQPPIRNYHNNNHKYTTKVPYKYQLKALQLKQQNEGSVHFSRSARCSNPGNMSHLVPALLLKATFLQLYFVLQANAKALSVEVHNDDGPVQKRSVVYYCPYPDGERRVVPRRYHNPGEPYVLKGYQPERARFGNGEEQHSSTTPSDILYFDHKPLPPYETHVDSSDEFDFSVEPRSYNGAY